MTKRLQVLIPDPDYRDIQRVARSRHMSVAEWVRQTLDTARRQEPAGAAGKKLDAIEIAVRHQYPSGEIEEILSEIESGYRAGMHP